MPVRNLLLSLNTKLEEYIRKSNDYLGFVRNFKESYEKSEKKTILKPHVYRSVVIHFYTIIELFSYDIVDTVLTTTKNIHLNAKSGYNDVDKKLRDNHLKSSIKLLQLLADQKRTDFKINIEQIIKNLYGCVNQNSIDFTTQSFRTHSSNLTHDNIKQLLSKVSINAVEYNKIKMYSIKVDNIVSYRNSLAHSFEPDDTMQSLDILLEYINDIEMYFRIWVDKIVEQYVEIQEATLDGSLRRYKIKNIFDKKCIAGFSIESNRIFLKQCGFVRTSTNDYIAVTINSIGIEKKNDYKNIMITNSTDVALQFNEDLGGKFREIEELIIFKESNI
jgi:hypothetical protein